MGANTLITLILGTLFWYCIHFSFVFTGYRVDDVIAQIFEHGLFAPVFASIIVIYRDRYRYRLFGFFGSVTTIILVIVVEVVLA